MKQKKLHFAFLMIAGTAVSNAATAQLSINNAQLIIQSNATVSVQGTLTSNVSVQGAGTVVLNGTSAQSLDMGGNAIPKLQVNNAANITLASNVEVDTTLTFTSGKIILGTNNLVIGNVGAVSGAGTSTGFIVTNGTGVVTKNSLGTTPFTFPVGDSTAYYFPLTLANSGTVDNYSVKCSQHVYTGGTTGTANTKEVVDASWSISEGTSGGSNLSVTAQWAAANELPGFNRTKGGIGYYITAPAGSVGWDLLNSQTSNATGSGPYTYTRSGFTSTGTFAIGTRPVESPLLAAPKVFLQGCYNTGTGMMNNTLGQKSLIPTTEPYSGLAGFTHKGSGGGETTTSAVLANNGLSTDIVDWVFVELRDQNTDTVVSTRSVLLQRNGTLVETDGTSPVNFAGNAAGNYYFSVRHRNHLGVRIMNTIALAKTTATNYNFTTALSQAYKGAVTNDQMATVSSGIYAMWGGNANTDAVVKMSGLSPSNNDYAKLLNVLGSSTNSQTNIYAVQDLNMDGIVKMSGLSPDNNDYAKLLNILAASTNSVSQPTF